MVHLLIPLESVFHRTAWKNALKYLGSPFYWSRAKNHVIHVDNNYKWYWSNQLWNEKYRVKNYLSMQYKTYFFILSWSTCLILDVTSLDYFLHKILIGKMFSWQQNPSQSQTKKECLRTKECFVWILLYSLKTVNVLLKENFSVPTIGHA